MELTLVAPDTATEPVAVQVVLPACQWRKDEIAPNRFHCASPKVHAPNGVPGLLCAKCGLVDHAPVANVIPTPPPVVETRCGHLWKRARDEEGKPKSRDCKT